MTLKIRRMLFYGLTVIFIVAGIIIIFYSNGWRFDFNTFTINQSGAIFFEGLPPEAIVIVNKNKFEFKPGFLKSGLLIANLFPKTYSIKVQKAGYQSWAKEIKINPSLVTEVPPIILMPEKLILGNPIGKNIIDFWINKNYLISLSEKKVLKFSASDGSAMGGKNQKLIGTELIDWSNSGDSAITKSPAANAGQADSFFWTDLKDPSNLLNLGSAFLNAYETSLGIKAPPIQKIKFYPDSDTTFIIQNKNGLYVFNADNSNFKKIYSGKVNNFESKNNRTIVAAPDTVLSINLSNKATEAISPEMGGSNIPFLKNINKIGISADGNEIILLSEDGKLFLFNKKSAELKIIAENATQAEISPDNKKIAFATKNKEVAIYNLEDKKMAILNIGSLGDKISWHQGSEYLFIKYPAALYLLEANDLPPINFQTIDSENEKYLYEPEKNLIYLLKKGNLYSMNLE